MELRRVGVEVADVDRLFLGGQSTYSTRPAPAIATSRSASALCASGSGPPTLNTSPLQASLAPARRNASAASFTYTKSRSWDPSP